MSLEKYLLVNLGADLTLLWAVARALGCFDGLRTLAAGLLCAAYGAVAAFRPVPWAGLTAQLALLGGVAALLVGRRSIYLWGKAALLLAGGALLAGGTGILLSGAVRGPMGVLCALLGAALLFMMLAARHPLRGDWQVNLALSMNGRTARFPALIDTGNRLREPLSGQPVLIAEKGLLCGLLPEKGWRELRFGAVGGGGRMACFKPAGIWIETGRRRARAPEVWVAVSPTPLPGAARALAPSEFAVFGR